MSLITLVTAMKYQGGMILGSVIDKIGFTSIVGFVGIKASDEAGVIDLAEHIHSSWGLADYALLTTIIGTVSFIVKNIIESYCRGCQEARDRKTYKGTKE